MATGKVNVHLDLPQLNSEAKSRVSAALHSALQSELQKGGHGNSAFFAEGGIKGMPANTVAGAAERGG